MKKNPIDELFAQKLAEHRQEPSQRALERFQEKLKENERKKRGGFLMIQRSVWYYGAAASVAIALTFGILSKTNSPKVKEIVALQPIKTIKTNKPTVNLTNKILPKSLENEVAVISIQPAIYTKNNLIKRVKKEAIHLIKATEMVPEVAQIAENPPPLTDAKESVAINTTNQTAEKETLAVTQSQTPDSQVVVADNSPKTNQIAASKADKEDLVLVLSELPNEPEVTPKEQDVVIADNTVQEPEERSEEPFLKRFWTQLKNLKNGEKVDLKALRIKPKELVARADESLKEDRQEARDSWQQFKSRFARKQKEQ